MIKDDFESQLERMSLKPLPASWREAILRGAQRANTPAEPTQAPGDARFRWRELLWPHPQAWAGLAAVWVIILVFHVSSRPSAGALSPMTEIARQHTQRALKEEQRLLSEWLFHAPVPVAEPPKSAPPGTHGVIEKPSVNAV